MKFSPLIFAFILISFVVTNAAKLSAAERHAQPPSSSTTNSTKLEPTSRSTSGICRVGLALNEQGTVTGSDLYQFYSYQCICDGDRVTETKIDFLSGKDGFICMNNVFQKLVGSSCSPENWAAKTKRLLRTSCASCSGVFRDDRSFNRRPVDLCVETGRSSTQPPKCTFDMEVFKSVSNDNGASIADTIGLQCKCSDQTFQKTFVILAKTPGYTCMREHFRRMKGSACSPEEWVSKQSDGVFQGSCDTCSGFYRDDLAYPYCISTAPQTLAKPCVTKWTPFFQFDVIVGQDIAQPITLDCNCGSNGGASFTRWFSLVSPKPDFKCMKALFENGMLGGACNSDTWLATDSKNFFGRLCGICSGRVAAPGTTIANALESCVAV